MQQLGTRSAGANTYSDIDRDTQGHTDRPKTMIQHGNLGRFILFIDKSANSTSLSNGPHQKCVPSSMQQAAPKRPLLSDKLLLLGDLLHPPSLLNFFDRQCTSLMLRYHIFAICV